MIKFYGYKRCSTSKKAQKWLDDHGVKYEFQDLVEEPPKKEDLIKWMNKYQDRGLRYFFNTSGQHYRQQKLKDKIPDMTIENDYITVPFEVIPILFQPKDKQQNQPLSHYGNTDQVG